MIALPQPHDGLLAALPLRELAQARQLTQDALAKALHSKQAQVSKLERRADMYVSSLRTYIEALGGELEIIARFPDGAVRITRFQDIAGPESWLADSAGTMPHVAAPRRRRV